MYALVISDQGVCTAAQHGLLGHRKAPGLELHEQLEVGLERRAALIGRRDLAQTVGEEAQGALSRNARVELAHRASGGVAWVHKRLFSLGAGSDLGALFVVERVEVVAPHVDLAPHFEHRRCVGRQSQRHLLDGAHVGRDLFAHLAVAARGGLHQHAGFIAQAHGQTVELEFGHIVHRGIGLGESQGSSHAGVEVARAAGLGVGLGVDREHGHTVAHRRKRIEHPAAHTLGRGIAGQQPGVCGFNVLQFPEQPVVLGVGDFRVVEGVVAVGVVVELGAQLGGSLGGARPRSEKIGCHDSRIRRTGGEPEASRPTGRGCPARRTGFPGRRRCRPWCRWTGAGLRRR